MVFSFSVNLWLDGYIVGVLEGLFIGSSKGNQCFQFASFMRCLLYRYYSITPTSYIIYHKSIKGEEYCRSFEALSYTIHVPICLLLTFPTGNVNEEDAGDSINWIKVQKAFKSKAKYDFALFIFASVLQKIVKQLNYVFVEVKVFMAKL